MTLHKQKVVIRLFLQTIYREFFIIFAYQAIDSFAQAASPTTPTQRFLGLP
jgi:hypothetical protein